VHHGRAFFWAYGWVGVRVIRVGHCPLSDGAKLYQKPLQSSMSSLRSDALRVAGGTEHMLTRPEQIKEKMMKRELRFPRCKWIAVAAAVLALAAIANAQVSTDEMTFESYSEIQAGGADRGLPAERIISLLREQPKLLAEAKKLLASELRDRGDVIEQDRISDTAIFARVREVPQFRTALTRLLVERGAVTASELPQSLDGQSSGSLLENSEEPLDEARLRDRDPAETSGLGVSRRAKTRRSAAEDNTATTVRKPSQPSLTRVPSPYPRLRSLNELYAQFSDREAKLQRFGEQVFQNRDIEEKSEGLALDLPAGPDYVLGPGDSLVINLHGRVSQTFKAVVDRQGRVLLPEVGAVVLAGKTLAAAQQSVEVALNQEFRDVKVDMSLSRLRTVRVYVVGDVERPGAYDVSSLSTPLHALYMAGGPTDRGSLRTIRHLRGATLVCEVDLYEFMLKGVRNGSERLQSGDTILVPPAGAQISVSGMVRRPAIYEVRPEATLAEVLDMAGGVMVTGALHEVKVERVEAHAKRTMLSVKQPGKGEEKDFDRLLAQFKVQDGDRVVISPILPHNDAVLYLDGHVFRPGKYPYREGMTVNQVITSYNELLPEPADYAELVRLRPPDMRPDVVPFNLRDVLEHGKAISLQPFDTIRIFGRYEVDAPTVSIYGEVLRPGEYPLEQGMTAAALVRMAGGFKRSAATDQAELSTSVELQNETVTVAHRTIAIGKALAGDTTADPVLRPGDVLTIHQLTGWRDLGAAVTVNGEVVRPGKYGIQEGEKLSSVLKRVGGLRPGAYANGAVLEREQVRELDRKAREALIKRMESAQPDAKDQSAGAAAFLQQQEAMLNRLKNQPPTGRLVIQISADISKWENTPADIEVRAGDVLTIPKKPSFVLVNGAVNNASAVTFAPGKSAAWYLRRAGGTTEFANKKQAFVIRANGSVVGNGSAGWFGGGVLATVLQPGDVVVVPEKIKTDSAFWRNLLNTAQITSSVAIAAKVATSF